MGLINQTQKEYYEGSDGVQNSGDENYGSYQFISLKNIINQFTIAYVGEDKIISKIKRSDVAFHAQRALQELSFDTFKSTKSFEYVVPPSLQMPLPQDYVNYIKLCYVGADGIKRVLQKTNKSSNPAAYQQNADGSFKLETNSFIRNFKAGENKIGVDEDGNAIYSPSIPPTNEYEEYGITKSGKTTSGNK